MQILARNEQGFALLWNQHPPKTCLQSLESGWLVARLDEPADGVTLVIDTCNLTVVEGHTVVLTLTDGTASDVAITNFARGAPSFAGTGDPSDSFRNFVIDPDNCRSMTLAAGKSCLLSIDYIADSDFGLNQWNLCAEVGASQTCTPVNIS